MSHRGQGVFHEKRSVTVQDNKIRILWITDTTSFGRGDFDYLQLMSHPAYLTQLGLALDRCEQVRIVCVDGRNDTLIQRDQNHRPVVKIDAKQDHVALVLYEGKDFEAKLEKHLKMIFKNQPPFDYLVGPSLVSRADSVVSIAKKCNGKPFTKIFLIGGHGTRRDFGKNSIDTDIEFSRIGFEAGFLMSGIIPPDDHHARVKSLFKLSDKAYLSSLIGVESPSIDDTQDFLENTLFIPGYLQHQKMAVAFINGVAQSKVALQFTEGMTFHLGLNLPKRERKLFMTGESILQQISPETCHKLIGAGYVAIVIEIGNGGTSFRQRLSDATDGKVLRLMINRWLNERSDFDLLYGAASFIAATSGDNTLNTALAKGVIPFYATQPWNDQFRNEFVEYLADRAIEKVPSLSTNRIEFTSYLFRLMPAVHSFHDGDILARNLSAALDTGHQKNFNTLFRALICDIQANNFETKLSAMVKSFHSTISKLVI